VTARVAVLGTGTMGSAAGKLIARHRDEVDLLIIDVVLETESTCCVVPFPVGGLPHE